jgi:hypothetical protein
LALHEESSLVASVLSCRLLLNINVSVTYVIFISLTFGDYFKLTKFQVGIERIIVGMHNNDGIVTAVRQLKISEAA